jgi:EAL domain-containing protein (putative c-di-GMP-specific phosphodiesterase class I)
LTLSEHQNRFAAFAFAAADVFLEIAGDGSIRHAQGSAGVLFGLTTDEIIGHALLEFFPPSEHDFVHHIVYETERGHRFGPILVPLALGFPSQAVVLSGCRLPDDPSHIYLALSEATFATMPEQINKRRDPTTGLLDRDGFEIIAKDTLITARALKQEVSLTFLRLADGKSFEERLSKPAATKFYSEMGALLRVSALNNAAGRLQSHRFGVLHDSGLVGEVIHHRLAALARRVDPGGRGVKLQCSTVSLQSDLSNEDASTALAYTISRFARAESDHDMPDTLTQASNRAVAEAVVRLERFRAILAERQFKFVCQPVVSFDTNKPHHHEVLLRFDDSASPYDLVTFAEDMDLVQDLDLAVCEAVADFLGRMPSDRPISLAVNISGRSITTASFVTRLLNLLINRALTGRLMFEITESARIEDLEGVNHVLGGLRRLGYAVCLDDFGAGSASFQYLSALEVDYVKIDGRYVREAAASRRNALMLKSIAGLCRDLGIKTVAEMVETAEQAKLMQELGFNLAQGYHFGRPQPIKNLGPRTAAPPALQARRVANARPFGRR